MKYLKLFLVSLVFFTAILGSDNAFAEKTKVGSRPVSIKSVVDKHQVEGSYPGFNILTTNHNSTTKSLSTASDLKPSNFFKFIYGIFTGVFTSLAAWYILFHILISQIEFLPSVYKCRTEDFPFQWKYRIKFKNIGYRDALDLDLVAKIRIKNLPKSGSVQWRAIYVPLDDSKIPKVSSHLNTKKRLAVFLLFSEIQTSAKAALPLDIQLKCEDNTVTLEEIMELGTESTLQIFGFAYDSFSGSRRLFESPLYTIKDIVEDKKSIGSEAEFEDIDQLP